MKITSLRVKVHRSLERYNNDEGELTVELEPGDDFEVEEPKLRAKLDALISAHWKEKKEAERVEMERTREEHRIKREAQRVAVQGMSVFGEDPCVSCSISSPMGVECENCKFFHLDDGDGVPF